MWGRNARTYTAATTKITGEFQQAYTDQMMAQCWLIVCNDGPALVQRLEIQTVLFRDTFIYFILCVHIAKLIIYTMYIGCT